MTMIEKVARVLCERDPEAALSGADWRGYADDARAAIEAMREPTWPMEESGWESYPKVGEFPVPAELWEAMIDRALKD